MKLYPLLPLTAALLTIASLTSCGTSKARINAAAVAKAQAEEDIKTQELIEQAKALRQLPDAPAVCGIRVKTGVVAGDRLDVIALKQDAALTKANDRIVNCAAFWTKIKASREAQRLSIPTVADQ